MPQAYSLTTFDHDEFTARVKLDLQIERQGSELKFTYVVSGPDEAISALMWPHEKPSQATRRDELWKTTVFEFFVSCDGKPGYFEVNVSPSGDWNIYEFSDYRTGLSPVTFTLETPLRSTGKTDHGLNLNGVLNLSDFKLRGPVVLGAAAVLEYQDGRKEYWALAHKGEKPDFHLRSSFVAKL